MIAPKSAHLVERAAERLRQSGALEGSAAQLLEPERHRPPAASVPPPRDEPTPSRMADAAAMDLLVTDAPSHDVAELEEALPRPPRPVIDLGGLARAGMFDWTHGRSRISEEFRLAQRQLLRTAFSPTAEAGLSNLLMVTSARPGEGKSFTALNLAGSVALQGDHHVLLIDSDAKRDSICQALSLADAPGLLDLAADPGLDPSEVILPTEIENLSILPVG
jgi:receptor protein-tyrosine kinase